MIGLLLKNPYVLLFGVLALLGAFSCYGLWMYHKGANNERVACEKEKKEAIDENIKIKKRLDVIPRPDTNDYIKRLREGKA